MLKSISLECPKDIHPRLHSFEIDQKLGFDIESIEHFISNHYRSYPGTENAWIGLEPEILQTPYSEILDFLSLITNKNKVRVIDFGAAYGRVGIACEKVFSTYEFIGYEIVKERAKEGNRVFKELEITSSIIKTDNILENSFDLPEADLYFVYDFSNPSDQRILLNKLADKFMSDDHLLIARGNGIRSLISQKYPEFHSAYKPEHKDMFTVYSSYSLPKK